MTPEQASRLAAWHSAAFAPARGWSAAEISALLARPSAQLVTASAGFALADLVGDQAELLTICIAPDSQRRGEGAALLMTLHERLRSQGGIEIMLEVAADNHAAQRLYAKLGYRQRGLRKAYYKRGDDRLDALVLSCGLECNSTSGSR